MATPGIRLLLLAALLLPACASAPQVLGGPTVADTGTAYAWTLQEGGWALHSLNADGEADELLDEGAFDQVLGPVVTPGGIAWARALDGAWSIHQIGVSERVTRRSQGATDALAAAWALERVQEGLVPGNAADLAQLRGVARGDRWPR
jgi:hypothetical protein